MSKGNSLLVLYLTPEKLFKENYLLQQQWLSIKTLIPCFLKSLYEGKINVKLHEFDKIFTGLKNTENINQSDVLAKVAAMWYYFTRVTHQSIGPRVGGFAEKMIRYWLTLKYKSVWRNETLSNILRQIFGIAKNYKNKVDVVIQDSETGRVIFIELRMSEHTGGKTAQESLLDKFNKILDLIVSNEIPRSCQSKGIKNTELIIALLFNEKQELIDRVRENYNKGRLNSLINYIMEENHIWGRIASLSKEGYRFCEGSEISKEIFKERLLTPDGVCILKQNFVLKLKILLGDEFFREILSKSFNELLFSEILHNTKQKNLPSTRVSDDIWIMYALTINEMKIARIFGETNVLKIYKLAKQYAILKQILDKFKDYYLRPNDKLEIYINEINKLIDEFKVKLIDVMNEYGLDMHLLETTDIVKTYKYLTYVCIGVFGLYLTLDIKKDTTFSECNWSE